MRIAIYVPEGVAAGRVRRMLERQITAEGHELAGFVDSPEAARAAVSSGHADEVWTAERHVSDVIPWLRVRHGRRGTPVLIPALLAAWWALRQRPVTTATALTMVGVAVALPAPTVVYETAPPAVTRTAPPDTPFPPPAEEPPVMQPVSDGQPEPSATPSPSTSTPPGSAASPKACLLDVEARPVGIPLDLCVG